MIHPQELTVSTTFHRAACLKLTFYKLKYRELFAQSQKNVEVLEIFKGSVSRYVEWWTRMHMSLEQQANSSDELSKLYSAIRKKTVKEKWEKLGTDFRTHTDKVSRLLFLFH